MGQRYELALYVYQLTGLFTLVPAAAVTHTLTTPAAWAGTVATMRLSFTTVYDALVAAKRTDPTLSKPEPEIEICVPPAGGPLFGETRLMTGATAGAATRPIELSAEANVSWPLGPAAMDHGVLSGLANTEMVPAGVMRSIEST